MENEFRKLTTIRKINDLLPIEGADNIEIAKIDGWQCVVKKGEFKKDDFCVYFEIDSFLPQDDKFEFLRKTCYQEWTDGKNNFAGFRLKTMEFKGQLSQGLALKTSILPEKMQNEKTLTAIFEKKGNISNQLKVIKYNPADELDILAGNKGLFPHFVKKTDQTRVQNIWNEWKKCNILSNIEFEVSLKLNGTSFTAYLYNGEYGICSRNMELTLGDEGRYNFISKHYKIEEKLKNLNRNLAIQGEIVGEKIQGNYEKLTGIQFYVFDIYDIDLRRHLNPRERLEVLNKLNEYNYDPLNILTHTPIYPSIKLSDFECIEDFLLYCEGKSINKKVEREGLVFKSYELHEGQVLSFKGISNKYLVRNRE